MIVEVIVMWMFPYKYFCLFDKQKIGVLHIEEAKKFFALVLELDYSIPNDRMTFRKVMKIVDLN